jgi:hypothetical protein
MKYKIFNETIEKEYYLEINEIINLIKTYTDNIFYKFIDNDKIKINNDIVINTEFICHRINKIEELNIIDKQFGIELDLRDDHKSGKIILAHDPFLEGECFEDYLQKYNHNILILNIKSERIEIECLEILKKNNIENYFFLDSSFPMIYLLNKIYKNNKVAYRFSEFESIENFVVSNNLYSYIWVDCFNNFTLNKENYNIFKSYNKKICIVSPELQKQEEKIKEYRKLIIDNNIIPDMVCCKIYNIIQWI